LKHISIKELKIDIDIIKVLNIISSNKSLEIDIDGNFYIDEECDKTTPIIYRSKVEENSSLFDAKTLALKLFKEYKPEINGSICRLNLLSAWQEIIDLNKERILYFDHQTDGVELFEDEILEEYGWHCIPCEISYREISEFIEKTCEGVLVYYDNEIQFNGFVIIEDITDVREKVYNFLLNRLNEKFENNDLDMDDSEIVESLEFFNIKV